MNILLDTCTFLWIVRSDSALSTTAIQLYSNPDNTVFLSPVSTWEMSVKYGLGRLPLAEPPHIYIPAERNKHRILSLPLEEADIEPLGRLPTIHNDPFDRMLICQAITRGLILLTPDEFISRYPVNVKW